MYRRSPPRCQTQRVTLFAQAKPSSLFFPLYIDDSYAASSSQTPHVRCEIDIILKPIPPACSHNISVSKDLLKNCYDKTFLLATFRSTYPNPTARFRDQVGSLFTWNHELKRFHLFRLLRCKSKAETTLQERRRDIGSYLHRRTCQPRLAEVGCRFLR